MGVSKLSTENLDKGLKQLIALRARFGVSTISNAAVWYQQLSCIMQVESLYAGPVRERTGLET